MPAPRPDRQLGSLFEVFDKLPVVLVRIPFVESAIDEVRREVLSCDGVLVWVNPIQDGVNRSTLDRLLQEACAQGIYVSADPDVVLKLGTKEVLFRTRGLSWGTDTALYTSLVDFKDRFPQRLAERGRLVLKQGRGNGGNGVWRIDLIESVRDADVLDARVRVLDAQTRDDSSETMLLTAFMDRCETHFAWSGCLVDQEYQHRLADGMIRCYFAHDEVVGFARQWPKGLLDDAPTDTSDEPHSSVMEGPDAVAYQYLRAKAEDEWVPQLKSVLGLERESLPVIWDADFLFGPKDESGVDTYALCEINVSAVWPFPAIACDKVANAALERSRASKVAKGHAGTARDDRR